ncbi:GNAT family N-acetyltransferase [Piscibacillus salipiscarius]|uniref:GNAT family N-acetyltransferase n=1 Tax=Piscibacillus salipiscarius TaxID=299480 RepID=A0ABW5QE95_9BACI|nr:GNAT family N-acetyltransferase [Piscibacillus salipiscarius]
MNIKLVDTKEQLEDAYQVRSEVFIKEQNVPPEIEVDEHESEAVHFVGYLDEKPVAASRLRLLDDYGKFERICVLKELRGKHYGQQIIQEMEDYLVSQKVKKAKLNAQTHAEEFYKRIGYETISDEFMDAGIPHVTMIKELS